MLEWLVIKKDLILFKVLCEARTFCFSCCSTVTFAFFKAVSEVIQDDVSKPEANPLNEIVIVCPANFCSVSKAARVGVNKHPVPSLLAFGEIVCFLLLCCLIVNRYFIYPLYRILAWFSTLFA